MRGQDSAGAVRVGNEQRRGRKQAWAEGARKLDPLRPSEKTQRLPETQGREARGDARTDGPPRQWEQDAEKERDDDEWQGWLNVG